VTGLELVVGADLVADGEEQLLFGGLWRGGGGGGC